MNPCAAEGLELLTLLSSLPKHLEFMRCCKSNPGFHTYVSSTALLELHLLILVSFLLMCLRVESVGLTIAMRIFLLLVSITLLNDGYSLSVTLESFCKPNDPHVLSTEKDLEQQHGLTKITHQVWLCIHS